MIRFIWDIVKQLPLPLLFGVGVAFGMFLLGVGVRTVGGWGMICLFVLVTILFVVSICQSSKRSDERLPKRFE